MRVLQLSKSSTMRALSTSVFGKVMLVTGASSGIGIDTVIALHATGADVYMQVRDMKKGKDTMEKILCSSKSTGKLNLIHMELDSFESIRAGVADFLRKGSRLHVLVNNAGENCEHVHSHRSTDIASRSQEHARGHNPRRLRDPVWR